MFGLKDEDIKAITELLQRFPEVETAIVFGSRAKGNYRNGSDVDLALKGVDITMDTVWRISAILNEETLMPYKFDVVGYSYIENADLVNHIDRVGQLLYKPT